jgi:hypothetical protein
MKKPCQPPRDSRRAAERTRASSPDPSPVALLATEATPELVVDPVFRNGHDGTVTHLFLLYFHYAYLAFHKGTNNPQVGRIVTSQQNN